MKDIFIIGAGGLGKEVAFLIEEINKYQLEWNILGYIDDNFELHDTYVYSYKVLGDLNYLSNMDDEEIFVVVAVSNYLIKIQILKELKKNINKKINFPTLIHPNVIKARNEKIGKGTIVLPNSFIEPNVIIGDFVLISVGSCIMHDTIIEDYCDIFINAKIAGNCNIGVGSLIGSSATILQGKKIGDFSRIGAGAVVLNDIPTMSTAVGIPAKLKK